MPGDPLCDLLGGPGPADVVTLGRVAAKLGQLLANLEGLDPFGDDPEAEIVREVDQAPHQRVVFTFRQAQHERAIDFQLVNGQAAQVTE